MVRYGKGQRKIPNVYQVLVLSADYSAFIKSFKVLETILSSIFSFNMGCKEYD